MNKKPSVPVGIIGLGTMGGAMAKNLINGGYSVLGFDIDSEKNANLKRAGGQIAASHQPSQLKF